MQPPPLAGADRTFLIGAAEAGVAEAEASRLVAERGADPAVRSLAERLITDLAGTSDELGHLAALKGLTLPAAHAEEKGAGVERLRGLGGTALDRAFLAEIMAHHPAIIALYERQANESSDPELKTFAAQTLPILREHLAHARQLAADRGQS